MRSNTALPRRKCFNRRRNQKLSIQQRFDRVIRMCIGYLSKKLTISNCIGMLLFADKHMHDYIELHRLAAMSAIFIDVNFEKVLSSDEFLELTNEQMITIQSLLIYNEMTNDDMNSAILLWSKYKRTERRKKSKLTRLNSNLSGQTTEVDTPEPTDQPNQDKTDAMVPLPPPPPIIS